MFIFIRTTVALLISSLMTSVSIYKNSLINIRHMTQLGINRNSSLSLILGYFSFFFLIICFLPLTALIELSTPIDLSLSIQPVKLPTDCGDNIDDNVKVVASGNGMMAFECIENSDTTLKEVNLTTLPYHVCRRLAQHTDEVRSVICANSQNMQSTYRGDSGIFIEIEIFFIFVFIFIRNVG